MYVCIHTYEDYLARKAVKTLSGAFFTTRSETFYILACYTLCRLTVTYCKQRFLTVIDE